MGLRLLRRPATDLLGAETFERATETGEGRERAGSDGEELAMGGGGRGMKKRGKGESGRGRGRRGEGGSGGVDAEGVVDGWMGGWSGWRFHLG